jgi:hypothetical protein
MVRGEPGRARVIRPCRRVRWVNLFEPWYFCRGRLGGLGFAGPLSAPGRKPWHKPADKWRTPAAAI